MHHLPSDSLTIDPPAHAWPALFGARLHLTPAHIQFRRELNLPTDAPIIMTGHQAEFWHVGILAKYLAADAAARASTVAGTPTTTAWLIVDHDTNESGVFRIPILHRPDNLDLDIIDERTLHLAAPHATGLPACGLPPILPSDADLVSVRGERSPSPDIARGIDRMLSLLRRHANAPNAAVQHAHVLRDLLAPFDVHAPILYATSLAQTSMFRDLTTRMARDPEASVHAYNAAVAALPQAGLTPLLADIVQDRFELPLWRLVPGKPRVRVYAEDLPSIPPDQLAPRALFMTALLRLAGCDLFIHGLGGGIYDHATDLWFRAWMPEAALAPTAVVTANRYLPFPPAPPVEPLPTALWRLHHARHDPALLGDPAAAATKRDLAHRIAQAKARGENPYALYRVMLSLLKSVRETHVRELDMLARAADRSRASSREHALRADRTWPFPLHSESSLRALQLEIASAFGM